MSNQRYSAERLYIPTEYRMWVSQLRTKTMEPSARQSVSAPEIAAPKYKVEIPGTNCDTSGTQSTVLGPNRMGYVGSGDGPDRRATHGKWRNGIRAKYIRRFNSPSSALDLRGCCLMYADGILPGFEAPASHRAERLINNTGGKSNGNNY